MQQINFIGSLEQAANLLIIIEHREQTTIDFSQNSATIFST